MLRFDSNDEKLVEHNLTPDPALTARFVADLDALVPAAEPIGVAVSGGPDSLALLLLAAAARPGLVAAASVDHRLREGSGGEAQGVAAICRRLGVGHAILTAVWSEPPAANLQAVARAERYRLLAEWAKAKHLGAIAVAHHADDQAETLLMRLARGAGIGGLGGARRSRRLADGVLLIRPLLGWRQSELGAICAAAGLDPVDDPANRDPRHDRTRIRDWLRSSDWADPARLAASASHLNEADQALDWALAPLVTARIVKDGGAVVVDPTDLPRELQRRLLLAAFDELGTPRPRGPDLNRAMAALEAGETVTLSGLKLVGGETWRLSQAPARRF